MTLSSLLLRGTVVLAILGSSWQFLTLCAAPATDDPEGNAKAESPAEKARRALDRTVSLDVTEQPLAKVLEQLQEQAKVSIVLDSTFIGNLDGVSVSAKIEKGKLRSALRALLTQHNLRHVIVGDTLVITTQERIAEHQLQQRVSVNFNEVTLKDALKQLSRETAVNIVLDPKATKEGEARLSLCLEEVSLETAVRLMAELADLKTVQVGNVMFVATSARAEKMRNDPSFATPPPPPNGFPMPATPVFPQPAGVAPLPPMVIPPEAP